MVGEYLLLPETEVRPPVTGMTGVGLPSGHLDPNPGRLGTDAVGAGAVQPTTGVNLYKWLKPSLDDSNTG